MNSKINKIIIIILMILVICICVFMKARPLIYEILVNMGRKDNPPITSIEIYRDTPVWELAKAVLMQNESKIEEFAEENPELLDYKDERTGMTLLGQAVLMGRYDSMEALLKAGADTEILLDYYGFPAIFFLVNSKEETTEPLETFLKYGANPNSTFQRVEITRVGVESDGKTPLMWISTFEDNTDKIKILVEYGADINYQMPISNFTPAFSQIPVGGELYNAHYLIVELHADVTRPFHYGIVGSDGYRVDEDSYLVERLRDLTYPLDSEEYKLKMEIVEEFANQGVDYYAEPIPENVIEYVKEMYPDTWEEYLKVY